MLRHIGPAKVLIVDDMPENLLALEALLSSEVCEVISARSAEQALECLLIHEFALAILDVQMPGMDGFQLAEIMRGIERTRYIPIVFVSAAGLEANYAFQGYESGAVDFLHKPLDVLAVRSKVKVFVEVFRQRKALHVQLAELQKSRHEQELLLDELRQTQRELQQAVRMRDDFLSLVSHELKTPLNTLILETQLRRMHLQRENQIAFSPSQLLTMVEKDEHQIRNLIRLIDDMLDVSCIRTGKLSIRAQPCDLAELTRKVLDAFRPQLRQAGNELQCAIQGPARGCWDAFRLEQVLANLLTNAIRYGQGKTIEVRVEPGAETVLLQVRDQGPGVAAEDRERIFRQFERGSDGETVGGLGLGLFITEQIVSAHGGRIWVQGEPGEGALFCVELPYQTLTEGAGPAV
ncbi:hybrid sensor histidine kinase/response regulator [Serpens gallinarum]|uniref:histidine kinase n=1 Tax=Serpens gallinarum TaxID=2763075 RepID=A0ABR8TMJ1_9PSED|nr:hybrid sensor histidine kinase/response regulator [Serpens gallinarum]MBD7977000.1 hybrid sensor histidine kinase/response regulator [Serpens gallinarum]